MYGSTVHFEMCVSACVWTRLRWFMFLKLRIMQNLGIFSVFENKNGIWSNSGVFGTELKLNFTSGGEIMRKSYCLLVCIHCNGNFNEKLFIFMLTTVAILSSLLEMKCMPITCLHFLFSIRCKRKSFNIQFGNVI